MLKLFHGEEVGETKWVDGKGMKVSSKDRKTRSDKKSRVNIYMTQEDDRLLDRLAMATGLNKTRLSGELFSEFLRNPHVIGWLMDKYQVENEFRLIPVTESGQTKYICPRLTEK